VPSRTKLNAFGALITSPFLLVAFMLRSLGQTVTRRSSSMLQVVPLLLVALTLSFYSTEFWQTIGRLHGLPLVLTTLLFLALAAAFATRQARPDLEKLAVFAAPDELRTALPPRLASGRLARHDFAVDSAPRLRRRERINLVVISVLAQGTTAAVVGLIIAAFFIVLGIITVDEVGKIDQTRPRVLAHGAAVLNGVQDTVPSLTWHYTANNVRDFAFAAGPNFRWDASGYNGILIESLYRPNATRWTEVNRMGREAIKYFSEQWFPYPWSHATTIEGPIEGMEYPMVIYCPSLQKREDQYWVLMHELGHQWFPMQVGSDERRYPWMDEGFNTFADYDAAEAFFKGTAYGDTVRRELLSAYAATAIPGSEQPMITKPDEVRQLYWTAYQKPALMLSILREAVLGRAEFDRAFREYTRRWKGKHPQPADFFRTIGTLTGRDLDWFWRSWIYTTARLDQAVDSVRARDDSTFLYLSNRAQMVLPVTLELRYADGTSETRNLPVDMWNQGSRFTYRLATAKRLSSAVIDPRAIYPDINRDNNAWRR